MPFCSQCGNQVGTADIYCGRCGAAQPPAGAAAAGPPPPPRPRRGPGGDPLASIDGRTASILCYIPGVGWIMSIIVLASERFRRDRAVRFHGFQALYLFVAWLIEEQVIAPMLRHANLRPAHSLLQAALVGAAVFMMVKAAHQEQYALPLFGELAQKSMTDD
jgi:uncharacterized membrane protein